MFQSLSIEGFRGFSKLELENLGRVNLIVGENNTGKTSLLEAIALVADPYWIRQLPQTFRSFDPQADERSYDWLQQQHNGQTSTDISAVTADGQLRRIQIEKEDRPPSDAIAIAFGSMKKLSFGHTIEAAPLRVAMISVQHKQPAEMVDAFANAIRIPESERQLESLLTAVDRRIRAPRIDVAKSKPFIAVDIGLRERIPLSQAGQGIYRLCAIFSELLGNKPQLCIIDEIENGIHYTALPVLWKGIAEVASRLDIQVFATTHSKECLEAAHDVFSDRDPYDLRVIQFDRVNNTIEGRTLDRRLIEAAIGSNIEMR